MGYVLEHEDEEKRLMLQTSLPQYSLSKEFTNLLLAPHQKVLDAGCGTGIASRYIVDKFGASAVAGCDISESRIRQATQLSKEPPYNIIRFFQSNLEDIKASDASYDVVVSRYVYEHLKDPQKVSTELLRVLKPKGMVHIIDFDGGVLNLYSESQKLQTYLEMLHQRLDVDLYIGRKIPLILKKAGFKNIRWEVEVVRFTGKDLEKEYQNTEMRFRLALPAIKQILGGDAEKFIELYLNEMKRRETTLFYNKFIVQAFKRSETAVMDRKEVFEKVCRAIMEISPAKIKLEESHTFVENLGFDSLRVAGLSLALEDEFGRPLLLNDWIAHADEPGQLTVGSLTNYLFEIFQEEI